MIPRPRILNPGRVNKLAVAPRRRSRAYWYQWVRFFSTRYVLLQSELRKVITNKTIGIADSKVKIRLDRTRKGFSGMSRWAHHEGSFAGASFTLHIMQPRLKIKKRPSSRTLALAYIILAKLDKRPGESPENAHSSFSFLRNA